MMKASQKAKLSEAFWFQEGPGVRNTQFRDSGVKLLNVGNITKTGQIDLEKTDRHLDKTEAYGKYAHFLADAGDLVIASSGISIDNDGFLRTRGAFVEERHLPLCMNTSTIRFKAIDGKSDLSYLRHWLQSLDFRVQITRLVTGSAQKNFGPTHLKSLSINLPPLDEQKRIAAILDQANELRRKRQHAIDRLNQLGQAIFHEMFFESSRSAWTEESLSEFCDIQVGFAFKSTDYTEDSNAIRLCRGANVLPSRIDWRDTSRLPNALAERHSEFALREKDIVIAMDRPWISEGFKTAMVGSSDLPALLVQRVARLRAKSANDSDFLYFLINSQEFQASCHTTETTVPHISPKDIRGFKFLCPPEAERTEFSKRSSHIRDLHEKAEKSFALGDQLFASLQHRAFQGEL